MAHGGNRADIQNAKAKLIESYNQILEEFTTGSELKNVGNYSLSRMIGKGSFGKVFLATHKLTGTKVVLKSAEKSDLNLAREIHHYRQLIHPHIARLYEVIVTETTVWLVLEYCPGDELYAYLIRKRRLTIDQAQRIFAQLCGAVAYIHTKNIVHRDLKLENILMDKHESVKLCDFGFTRECEPKRLLQTFCGTICYAAPEMVKGEKYHGQSVDVWSLGIILYALLCGELPFDDDDEFQIRLRISNEEPVYPDYLPEEALSLLRSMLSKKSTERPSATEILQHPFLAPYSSAQIALLLLPDPVPFTTKSERDLLDRLRHAFVDIEAVKESVVKQKCDNMAGWWALALEREERNSKKYKKKRKSDKYKRFAEDSLTRRNTEVAMPLRKPATSESNGTRLSKSVEATPEVDSGPINATKEQLIQRFTDHKEKKPLSHGLAGAFASMKHWASVSHLGLKRASLLRADSSTRRSSIRSFFSLVATSTKSKTLDHKDASAGNARNSPKATWDKDRKGVADSRGNGVAKVKANDLQKEQQNLNHNSNDVEVLISEDIEIHTEENGGILKSLNGRKIRRNLPPSVKLAIPNRMYSSDSMRSASGDRHHSPSSSYIPRIGRTSTSSSVSSLISASRHKSTMSRASSTSSNSISSRNASRSPRSSSKYLPSTPIVDNFDRGRKSWRQFDRKSTRMQSYDDDSVSFSSTTPSMSSAQSLTPNTTVFSNTGFGSMGRGNRLGRQRTGFNETVFFGFGQGSARGTYEGSSSKRKRIPFRGPRGRKGVPENAGDSSLAGPSGFNVRRKSADGDIIEEVDEPETVEDEAEFSDDEGVNSRRTSLAD
ncbi:kinase-like domain-containing protein [Lipomyces chichibuensis]|uniref:kinase-like domain-containing protein n=1 Tax=Lipomyces chichibuensis TaxID=1546026 RepID=UPI003343A6D0